MERTSYAAKVTYAIEGFRFLENEKVNRVIENKIEGINMEKFLTHLERKLNELARVE